MADAVKKQVPKVATGIGPFYPKGHKRFLSM